MLLQEAAPKEIESITDAQDRIKKQRSARRSHSVQSAPGMHASSSSHSGFASEFTPQIVVGGRFPHFELQLLCTIQFRDGANPTGSAHDEHRQVQDDKRNTLLYRSRQASGLADDVFSSIDLPNIYVGNWVRILVLSEDFWVRFGLLKKAENSQLGEIIDQLLRESLGGEIDSVLQSSGEDMCSHRIKYLNVLCRSWSSPAAASRSLETEQGSAFSACSSRDADEVEGRLSVDARRHGDHSSYREGASSGVNRMAVHPSVLSRDPDVRGDESIWLVEELSGRLGHSTGIRECCVVVRPDGHVASVSELHAM